MSRQPVTIELDGQSVAGFIIMMSPNKKSLLLEFDKPLWTDMGAFMGKLACLLDDDGVYRDIMHGLVVKVTPSPIEPSGPRSGS